MKRKKGAKQPVMRKATGKPRRKAAPLLIFKGNGPDNTMAKAEQKMREGSLAGCEFHRLDLVARLAARSPG